jgi:hypothetical protein
MFLIINCIIFGALVQIEPFKTRPYCTLKPPQGFPLTDQVLDKMLHFAESYLFIIFPNKLSLCFLSQVILEDETRMVIKTCLQGPSCEGGVCTQPCLNKGKCIQGRTVSGPFKNSVLHHLGNTVKVNWILI